MTKQVFKIKYNPSLGEYKVTHKDLNDDKSYFTDDKDDAIGTAHAMAKEMGFGKDDYEIKHSRVVNEDTEQLDEISTTTLGSYIKKAHDDIQKRKELENKINSDPKVQDARMASTQAWKRREYTKNGHPTKSVQSARKRADDNLLKALNKVEPNWVDKTNTYKRRKGIETAVDKLQYNKRISENTDKLVNEVCSKESLKKKLAEKILEAIQELEELTMISEISKQTLGNYIKKAKDSLANNTADREYNARKAHDPETPNQARYQEKTVQNRKMIRKRSDGIDKATDKLVNEDTVSEEYVTRNINQIQDHEVYATAPAPSGGMLVLSRADEPDDFRKFDNLYGKGGYNLTKGSELKKTKKKLTHTTNVFDIHSKYLKKD